MDWIQILFVAAGVIAYWLNQRAKEKAGEDADYDGDGIPERRAQQRELTPSSRDGTDPEQAERVRRIQEEIRRKIAERRGETPAPPPMPRQVVVVQEHQPVFREPVAPPPLREPDAFAHDDSAALERQRKLAEQMERLDEQRREARRLAATTFSTQRQATAATHAARAREGFPSLKAELRDPRALRRAVVLREVLDAPMALR